MGEQNRKYPIAPTYPLHQLIVPPFEVEEAIGIMVKHGCTLEEHPNKCIVFFPEGTTKTEIYLRTMQSRYLIMLPDGYELLEMYDRYREVSLFAYRPE